VLLQAEARGLKPQALADMPEVPWYYQDYLKHYRSLSRSRTMRTINVKLGTVNVPNPIDISSIILYNVFISKENNFLDFLDIIQTLDDIYITHYMKKVVK
jgi:hypothetical protein